ncbi:unannotated protein [freshwater metagenome]|uniref:Unannotated protein n=1 Tax=freshwater metagenome TaxID=449393 RepID=A0A6J7QVQ0_9ZZZZ
MLLCVRRRRVRGRSLLTEVMLIATDEARINDRIRAREVRLIGAEGEQLGTVALPDALRIAREAELDLVEVAPNNVPPVCKIMDFGRWQYEQEQRRKESRKKATNVVIKEMKFRPKIDIHDYTTKMRHVQKFLGDGNKVKLTIMFRGREMAHPELGRKILDQIATDVVDYALVESAPRQDGRNMTMVLHPVKKAGKAKPKVAGKGERGSSKAPAVEAPATPAPSTEAPVATEVPEAIVPVVEGAALDSAAVVNEVVVSEVE